MRAAILIVLVAVGILGLTLLAYAQMTTLSNSPMVPTANPVGPMVNDGLSGPMIPGTTGAAPAPPIDPCGTGVINLSTGCTQPMLGGL